MAMSPTAGMVGNETARDWFWQELLVVVQGQAEIRENALMHDLVISKLAFILPCDV
jgi:hypothetical protein